MIIGLIDVDGHNFPNLALMRISAFYKSLSIPVEWYASGKHYNIVYKSKIFSFSKDVSNSTIDADVIKEGGTGYAITTKEGKETFNIDRHNNLPDFIEHQIPDYSIYPQFDFAVSMTSRGCPRDCPFCHVAAKEGKCSVKVADVNEFWHGQKKIVILDPNLTACKDKYNLYQQYIDTGAKIVISQGLDIRLLTSKDMEYINKMRLEKIHFAWDNANEDLKDKFKLYADNFRRKTNIGTVYCLVNYNSTMEENLYRIYTLRDLGFDPYVMIYDKQHAPREIKHLQRWCNNKIIFKTCKKFDDYMTK